MQFQLPLTNVIVSLCLEGKALCAKLRFHLRVPHAIAVKSLFLPHYLFCCVAIDPIGAELKHFAEHFHVFYAQGD